MDGYSDIPWGVLALSAAGYALIDLYGGTVAPLLFLPVLIAFFVTARMRIKKGEMMLAPLIWGSLLFFGLFLLIMAVYEGVFFPLIPYTLIENNLQKYLCGAASLIIIVVGVFTARERYLFTGAFSFITLVLSSVMFDRGEAAFIMTFGNIGMNTIAFGIWEIRKNTPIKPKRVKPAKRDTLIVEMSEEEIIAMMPDKPKRVRRKKELPERIGGFVRRPVLRFDSEPRSNKRYVLRETSPDNGEELFI